MRSLLLLNGSPRGPRSNSMKMLARIAEGWMANGGDVPEVLHLAQPKDFRRAVEAFGSAEGVLLGMPLYTDSMPALVKAYIEALASRIEGSMIGGSNPVFGFLVQSGFPEALHSRPLERYLEKLAKRLGSPYAGTIVHGGGEALQIKPDAANQRLWALLRTLGGQLARKGRFSSAELQAIAGIERLSKVALTLMPLVLKVPILQFYWNRQLKKNGAWNQRFATPYLAISQGSRNEGASTVNTH
jgi:hypothetical protein